jgi:hypothetical protein
VISNRAVAGKFLTSIYTRARPNGESAYLFDLREGSSRYRATLLRHHFSHERPEFLARFVAGEALAR